MAWEYPPSFPELFKVDGRGAAEVGVDAEVFTVISQDKVLRRFVEQIVEDVHVEEIFQVSSQNRVIWVQQRCVEQNFCINFTHFPRALAVPLGALPSSASPLYMAVTCPCVLRQSTAAFGRILLRFLREGELGGHAHFALENLDIVS